MKKIVKTILTILFVVVLIFAIRRLIVNFTSDGLFFVVFAFTLFFMHLFAWIAPKTFCNLCWKITDFLPDSFDYDTSYRKLEIVDIGMLTTSIILLGVAFAF